MLTAVFIVLLLVATAIVMGRWAAREMRPLVTMQIMEWRGRARGRTAPKDLVRLLKAAATEAALPSVSVSYLPNSYRIGLAARDFERLSHILGLLSQELAGAVSELVAGPVSRDGELPLQILGRPRVLVYLDDTAAPGVPRIFASFTQDTVLDTTAMAERPSRSRPAPAATERLVTILISVADRPAKEMCLRVGSYGIGRNPDADIPIDHETISWAHAEIIVDMTGARVTDSGSRNGTSVNEKPAHGRRVCDGDVIRLSRAVAVEALTGCARAA
jgi:hypothetical protein